MLNIPVPSKIDIPINQTVETSVIRIRGVWFDFDNTSAIACIAFGHNEDEFLYDEAWRVSGESYITAIKQMCMTQPIANELLTKVAEYITSIQMTPGLKDKLIEIGELVILENKPFTWLPNLR